MAADGALHMFQVLTLNTLSISTAYVFTATVFTSLLVCRHVLAIAEGYNVCLCSQGLGQHTLADSLPLGHPDSALPNGSSRFQGKLGASFEPLSPSDVEKLNAAFATRHQAALLGSHLRA